MAYGPFHFLAEAVAPRSGPELAEHARRAEDLGYSALVVPDHLLGFFSPIAAMTAVAAATTTLRVSAFVLNNDLRHPAVLAAELATLDVISGGRVTVAIGAGWNEREYAAIGLPFDRTPVRQARLAESVTVLKKCFAGEPFTFSGEFYSITDYRPGPATVQRPHPPFLIGGGGRRTLTLAAREADIVGLAPRIGPGTVPDAASLTLEAAREKVAWIREAAGDRFDQLELNVYPSGWPVVVTDDARAEARKAAADLARRTGVELTEQQIRESPHLFIGSVDELVEKFQRLREELGVRSIMVGDLDDLAPVVARLVG